MILADSHKTAHKAGLRYVSRAQPGIQRIKAGRRFRYVTAKGKAITAADRKRIEALVIPPAWRDVWVCPMAGGHLQATGLDARGRVQYRYHDDWTVARNESKFESLPEFGKALPVIRRTIKRHLRLPGMPREKILACVVHLLDQTLIRVGNDEYARDNASYGLTTMRNQHVKVRAGAIDFNFMGKSGKRNEFSLDDPIVAKIIRTCQELPGQELFGFINEAGESVDVNSHDVNSYLSEMTDQSLTAKDFRTWGGTVAAAEAWEALPTPSTAQPLSQRELKKRGTEAIKAASVVLHNTVATCRKFYVHPKLFEGSLHRAFAWAKAHRRPGRMSLAERAVLHLLKKA